MGGFDVASAYADGRQSGVSDAVDDAVPMPPVDGAEDTSKRLRIEISADEYQVVERATAALCLSPEVYQRGGDLVHVVRDASKVHGVTSPGGRPRILPLSLPRLRKILTEVGLWTRPKSGQQLHPPSWAVQEVAAERVWKGVRYLSGVVEVPVLRPDGTVLDTPGYDAATELLFEPNTDFGRVPEHPSQADARRALDELLEIVIDFPFVSTAYRSAYLSGLLTPFARHAFSGPVPLHLVDANTRGSGKSLLADTVSVFISGREMARTTYPRDPAEMEKRITAIALAGDAMMLIDNVVGELGDSFLDAALTGTLWRGRILGKTEMAPETPLFTIWWANGNNVALVADTARRVLHIRMESDEEKPEERSDFRHPNLLEWIQAERPRLVRAALTVLRAYVVAGKPEMQLKPWGSFSGWSRLVRNAIVWAGEPDPGSTRSELAAQHDQEAVALIQLIEGMSLADPCGEGLTAAQILERSAHGNDLAGLREAIAQLCPTRDGKPPHANRFGRQLQLSRRRVLDGRYIDRTNPGTKHSALWAVFTGTPAKS